MVYFFHESDGLYVVRIIKTVNMYARIKIIINFFVCQGGCNTGFAFTCSEFKLLCGFYVWYGKIFLKRQEMDVWWSRFFDIPNEARAINGWR